MNRAAASVTDRGPVKPSLVVRPMRSSTGLWPRPAEKVQRDPHPPAVPEPANAYGRTAAGSIFRDVGSPRAEERPHLGS